MKIEIIINKYRGNYLSVLRVYGVYIAYILLIVISFLIAPQFVEIRNLNNIFRQASILGIVAFGQTIVILGAGLDLSVGGTISLATVLMSSFMGFNEANILPLILLCIFVGGIIGLINGIFVTKMKVPPLIATLGMSFVVQGGGLLLTRGVPRNTLSDRFRYFGMGFFKGIPVPVIICIIITTIIYFLIHRTNFGRKLFAAGGNISAAYYSGIRTDLIVICSYIFSGILASVTGILLAAWAGEGNNWLGDKYSLMSIATVVIGGTSLFGGKGNIIKTMMGALIIATLTNILLLNGVSYQWQNIVQGLIIIAAVSFYSVSIE